MAETIDDLTIAYEEEGTELVKELDKKVLTKGVWSTIVYKYQNFERAKNDFGAVAYSIRRYQKRNGVYQLRSKFNISNEEQARKLIEILSDWLKEE